MNHSKKSGGLLNPLANRSAIATCSVAAPSSCSTCGGGAPSMALVQVVTKDAYFQYVSNARSMKARSNGASPWDRMLSRYDAAALAALLVPCPVIGSLRT